jgi:SAM-dependent methyltransferase
MKLNLGCGQNKRYGFINIDKYATFAPDLLWDLEKTPYPFDADSVTYIAATHVLEHLGRDTDIFLSIMKELHRILVPGGKIDIKVPHFRGDGYWGDPTHVRPVTPVILGLFSKRNCRMFAERGWPNTPLADYLDIDFDLESTTYALQEPWLGRYQRKEITAADVDEAMAMYWNVVDEITMVLRKVGPA